MRAYRDAERLYASVELEDLPGKDLSRLVDASFTVRLRVTVNGGVEGGEAFRDVSFDGLRYTIRVSETGGVHITSDSGAAWAIVSRFGRISLGPVAAIRFPIALGCKVVLSLPEDPDYDPMVVWGYKPAAAYRELDSLGVVPYY